MSKNPKDMVKIDTIFANNPGAVLSTAAYSHRFSMQNYDQAAVIVTLGTNTTNCTLKGYIVCGNATQGPSSYVALANTSFEIPSGSTVKSAVQIDIAALGTVTTASTGITIVVDGITFTAATVGNATAYQFAINSNILCVESIATVIPAMLPYIEAAVSTASATAAYCYLRPKYGCGDRLITVATTLCSTASSDKVGVRRYQESAIIQFSAQDMAQASTAYSHAALFVGTSESSALPFTATLVRSGGRFGITQTVSTMVKASTLTS